MKKVSPAVQRMKDEEELRKVTIGLLPSKKQRYLQRAEYHKSKLSKKTNKYENRKKMLASGKAYIDSDSIIRYKKEEKK